MQVTFDSAESLDKVLQIVGSLYGVQLAVASGSAPAAAGATRRGGRRPAKKAAAKRAVKATAGRPRRAAAARSQSSDLAAVRQWARENGHQVADRGRISAGVISAYRKANRGAK